MNCETYCELHVQSKGLEISFVNSFLRKISEDCASPVGCKCAFVSKAATKAECEVVNADCLPQAVVFEYTVISLVELFPAAFEHF